jgi:hypothetical protein
MNANDSQFETEHEPGSISNEEVFHGLVPLTSVEQFHLYDSDHDFPNAITGRFHFRGTIDRALAQRAWEIMLRRQRIGMWPIRKVFRGMAFQPDLADAESEQAIVESTFHWQEVDSWPKAEADLRLNQANSAGIPFLDMEVAGYGIWCLAGKEKATLVLSVHHAYTDGPGGVIIIRDWLTIYHNLVLGRPATKGLGRLDFKKWRTRNRLGLSSWNYLKKLPLQPIAIFGAAKFVMRKFCYFGPNVDSDDSELRSTTDSNYGFPGVVGRWIESKDLKKIDRRAEDYGVRPNSLLMLRLIRTVGSWKSLLENSGLTNVNDSFHSKWVRVILPISIRRLADRHLPAANKATIVQIDRTVEETENERQACRMLDREIKIIVGFSLEKIFLIVIRLLSISPWLLKRLAKNRAPRGTVIFTNLGAPLRKTRACDFSTIGNLELVDFDLLGPIRPGTPLNVAFQRHEDRARITLHYDRRVFSSEIAEKFVESLVAAYVRD